MELVEIKCANCSKEIYVRKGCIRDKMFCTLECLDAYSRMFKSDCRALD